MTNFIFVKNKIINLDHVTAIECMEKGDTERIKIRFVNGHILHVDQKYLDVNKLQSQLSAIISEQ
jgi:argininosuccinate synthase